ncbi:MAG: hypothetical protein P8N76_07995 [Pirellulaceae bacterium]|nr:hypothetical protein [Pirellulaceae bacterium]
MSFTSKSDHCNLFYAVDTLQPSGRFFFSAAAIVMAWITIPTILARISDPIVVAFNMLIMLAMIYLVAAAWLNRTVLHVTRDKISLRQRPIPMPLPLGWTAWTANIKQVIVRTVAGTTSSYEIWVLFKNGDSLELLDLGELDDADVASQIERQIETFLHIEDDDTLNDVRENKHVPGV